MIVLFFSTQNSFGPHIAFYSMDTYDPLPGVVSVYEVLSLVV
jgi:hypothetical protein